MSEGFRHLIRICGTDVDGTMKVPFGLSKIKGVGQSFARAVVVVAKINIDTRIGVLTDDEIHTLEEIIENPRKFEIPSHLLNRRKDLETGVDKHVHGADLTLAAKTDVDFLKGIKCWRGIRHSLGLKVRGQKTRTCGRTGRAVGVKKRTLIAAAAAEAAKEK